MNKSNIISKLPYTKPFLFVDEITEISNEKVIGSYTYKKDEYFYQGHFKDNPITPGVILTETMAQIGLVCMGIYLLEDTFDENVGIGLTSNQIDFFLPVFPNQKVKVVSEKIYFRFNKLKCKVTMYNQNRELVCRGTISGMIISKRHE